MQDVLGGDRLLADAALGKGDILGNPPVEMMGDHEHIKSFIERIHRVGPCRIRRRRNDVRFAADLDDVGRMSATSPFSVKGVNGPALEGRDGIFDKAALIQRVGVDDNLYIHVIGDGETAIDGSRSRTPVFMKLQATDAGLDLFNQTCCQARAALTEKAQIHGEGVSRLEHPLNMPRSRRAGRGGRPRRRPRASAHHRGKAGIERLLDLLRTDEMNMDVDATGSNDLTFARDHLGSRADDYLDVWLHVGIAGLAYRGDPPVLDADIGLHNAPVVQNDSIGDDRIDRTLAAGTLRLAHAVADDFSAPELHLLAVDGEILLHFDDEIGISEAHSVANRWAKHLRVSSTGHS